jgi:hypothetical protein
MVRGRWVWIGVEHREECGAAPGWAALGGEYWKGVAAEYAVIGSCRQSCVVPL